jgi:5'-deoxynucleotidase YfbR-like HD superfamily hydrolase
MVRAQASRRDSSSVPRAWQRMLSGRRLNLIDPSPLDIEIEDIAHGLARVARWNGQTSGEHIYSVAQHSVLVEAIAHQLSPRAGIKTRLAVLLHDAAEYVIGDMISPFKSIIGSPYREAEARILDAILTRCALPAPTPKIAQTLAKKADIIAAWHEATTLAGFERAEADEIFGPPSIGGRSLATLLAPMPVGAAQALFLERFRALDAARATGEN